MLKQKIEDNLIEALKSKDEITLSVLRMLKSAIQNSEIQKKAALEDTDILSVIQGQIKQRHDSIALYEQGKRQELADKEKAEIEVLKKYLPEQMGEEEIRNIVTKAISETGAADIKDMGKVMGAIMPQVKGKADGGLVSQIVKNELSK